MCSDVYIVKPFATDLERLFLLFFFFLLFFRFIYNSMRQWITHL